MFDPSPFKSFRRGCQLCVINALSLILTSLVTNYFADICQTLYKTLRSLLSRSMCTHSHRQSQLDNQNHHIRISK